MSIITSPTRQCFPFHRHRLTCCCLICFSICWSLNICWLLNLWQLDRCSVNHFLFLTFYHQNFFISDQRPFKTHEHTLTESSWRPTDKASLWRLCSADSSNAGTKISDSNIWETPLHATSWSSEPMGSESELWQDEQTISGFIFIKMSVHIRENTVTHTM